MADAEHTEGTIQQASQAPDPGLSQGESGQHTEQAAPPTQLPLWQELGHSDAESLKKDYTTTRQRATTAQQEAERYKRELDEERQRRQDYENRIMAFANPQAQQPTYQDLQAAYEGYLNGDTTALTRFQQEQDQRQQRSIQEAVQSTLTTVLRPTQYAEKLTRDYPDLGKTDSPLYQALWQAYDAFAGDPETQLLYGELLNDKLAMRDAPSPDGSYTKPVNLRLAHVLAGRLEAQLAREQLTRARQEGRVEEAQRRSAASGEPPGGRRETTSEPDPWEALSEAERRSIENLVAQGITPAGWPRVQDLGRRKQAFARHLYERRQKRAGAA